MISFEHTLFEVSFGRERGEDYLQGNFGIIGINHIASTGENQNPEYQYWNPGFLEFPQEFENIGSGVNHWQNSIVNEKNFNVIQNNNHVRENIQERVLPNFRKLFSTNYPFLRSQIHQKINKIHENTKKKFKKSIKNFPKNTKPKIKVKNSRKIFPQISKKLSRKSPRIQQKNKT